MCICVYAGKTPDITLNNEGAVDAKDLPRESCVVDSKIFASTAAIQHCHMYHHSMPEGMFCTVFAHVVHAHLQDQNQKKRKSECGD